MRSRERGTSDGISVLIRRGRETRVLSVSLSLSLPLPGEDIARRQPSASQEESPPQNHSGTLILELLLPEL